MLAEIDKSEKHGKKRKRDELVHVKRKSCAKLTHKSGQGSSGIDVQNKPHNEQDITTASTNTEYNVLSENAGPGVSDETEPPPKQRFIVFIGNLPYSTSDSALRAHFAKIKPSSVRHITEKGTEKSKGYAFLEFEAFDRMHTCLKSYHHSLFDDGQGGKPRRLNVELTAGGGGSKSLARKEKLKAKNQKLSEQRKRMAKLGTHDKRRRERQNQKITSGSDSMTRDSEIMRKKTRTQAPSVNGANSRSTVSQDTKGDLSEIHPSRRKLMHIE